MMEVMASEQQRGANRLQVLTFDDVAPAPFEEILDCPRQRLPGFAGQDDENRSRLVRGRRRMTGLALNDGMRVRSAHSERTHGADALCAYRVGPASIGLVDIEGALRPRDEIIA